MIRRILRWWTTKNSIAATLNPERVVVLHGIRFTIRKINPLDHLTGADVLRKMYDIYSTENGKKPGVPDKAMIEKLKAQYKDALMAGVVSVRCHGIELAPSRKPFEAGEHKIMVDNLMTDWSLAEELYREIIEFTYGKKKLKRYA